MIHHVDHIVLTTRDLAGCIRFYTEVLGFETVAEFDFDDAATAQVMDLPGCRFKGIFMKCDGMRIELIGFTHPVPDRTPRKRAANEVGHSHLSFYVTNLDEALAEMARVLKPGGRAVFIYPAEPIQGLYAIPTSVILHGTPFKAREVHCHKLWPSKLAEMASPHGLTETAREFSLLKSPQFASVFEKTG